MRFEYDRRPPPAPAPVRPGSDNGWYADLPPAEGLDGDDYYADWEPVQPHGRSSQRFDQDYEEPDDYFDDEYGDDAEYGGTVFPPSTSVFGSRSMLTDDGLSSLPPPPQSPGRGSRPHAPGLGARLSMEPEYGDEDEFSYQDYFADDDDDEVEDLVERTSAVTRNALEWAVVLVGALLIALLLRVSLFQAYYIPSESMESTLSVDDRVMVNKISYRLHDIHRGDVVVFARPDGQEGPIKDLIKRVIGLPGETVEARDNIVYINGIRLQEPYLDPGIITADFGPTVVPEGEVFVMGDNRGASFDSRRFGSIGEDRVVGRAFVLFWPINRLGPL
ncbi:MAG: signal peptidase I [Actinomycetota bacterium]